MFKNYKFLIAVSIVPQYLVIKWLSNYPEFIETYYSNGFYPLISKLFRFALGWLPFSFGDVFYGFSVIYILRWLLIHRKRIIKDTRKWLIDVTAAMSIIYLAFHLLWGLNYYRLPLHKNLNLEADYTTEQLVGVTKSLIDKSNAIHNSLVANDTIKVEMPFSKTKIIKMAPMGYTNLEEKLPHLVYAPKSIKVSTFSTLLTYMGYSGYLNPLTNEAHVDGLIPAYKFPTTVSHEVAHQLGYAAENEANFIGFLATSNHENIHFKYSGYTFGLRHCLVELYRRDEALYEELKCTINIGILKNYQEVQEFWLSYQNPLEPFFKFTYSTFLKANNQEKGMQSYSYVVALIVNYLKA
jgi:hypothetical protein